MFRMRRNSRRLTATWLAVVMALAPITCVCADRLDDRAAVAEASDALPDCHADRSAPPPDTEETHCAACGEPEPAPVTKAETGTAMPAIAASGPPLVPSPRAPPGLEAAATLNDRPDPTRPPSP